MEPARFCSDCKVQMGRSERAAPWPFGGHCARCAHKRVIGLAFRVVLLGSVFVTAVVMDRRLGRAPEVSFIGSAISPARAEATPARAATVPAVPSPQPDRPAPKVIKAAGIPNGICGAPTKSGKPCQRKVKGGGYCWQHKYLQKQ